MHVFKFRYVGFGLVIMRTEVGTSVSYKPNYKTILRYFYYTAGLSSLSTSFASKEICGAEECVRFTVGDEACCVVCR
jgi:hypothetical protein